MSASLAGFAGEDIRMHQGIVVDRGGEKVLQAFGEMEGLLLRHVIDAAQHFLGAGPADLDSAEEIGLGARHLEDALRLERRLRPKDLRVGAETHFGAALVRHAAEFLQLALRRAAFEDHAVMLLLAPDFDFKPLRQRIGDRNADTMQAARSFINLGVEFAAGVQRRHYDFEGRLALELRMRIDWDATSIVGDADKTVGLHIHFDESSVAGQRLVHGVVDYLGEEVMQRLLIGAADIHAGAAAHRLEPFQHLDMTRAIAGVRAAAWRSCR